MFGMNKYKFNDSRKRYTYWFLNIISAILLLAGFYLLATTVLMYHKVEMVYVAFTGVIAIYCFIASAVYSTMSDYQKMQDKIAKLEQDIEAKGLHKFKRKEEIK